MNKSVFWHYILGDGPLEFLLAALVFAYVGAFVALLINVAKRTPDKAGSPLHFSLSYLLCDNAARIVVNFILIALAVRFSTELMGAKLTMYVALVIGLGFDRLIQLAKDKGLLGPGKDA